MSSVQSLHPQLSRGSTGSSVRSLQQALTGAGFDPGGVDGDFGPLTRAALKRFQTARNLLADGVAGPETWKALDAVSSGTTDAAELGQGSSGVSVENLQRGLQSAGFDPQGIDGDFGPLTDAALRNFQQAKGLEVDGVAGPATWRALRGPTGEDGFSGSGTATSAPETGNNGASSTGPGAPQTGSTSTVASPGSGSTDLRQRILQIAESQLGTDEATNNNDGAILKYPHAFGRGSEAWCADFVSWVNTQAGNPMNDPYCPSLESKMIKAGQWKGQQNPKPGDLVFFDWNGDRNPDHVGIVKSVNSNGTFTTIEGNTGTGQAGGEEGVHERTRTLGTILGFANPA
jgi:peptidoglycan hydrolase-like protein with peptidoglycan-binding domain